MADIVYPCPSCGALMRTPEAMIPNFHTTGLFCTNKLANGNICGSSMDRRKQERRSSGLVVQAATMTGEDEKLLKEMGIAWEGREL